MTNRKTTTMPAAVVAAEKRSSIPKRPVIQHTALFRAELQAALNIVNNEMVQADSALSSAADERDMAISLANQKFDAIRAGLDAERNDILLKTAGIEAALKATEPAAEPSNIVAMAAE